MTQEKEAFDAARSMIESSLDALVAVASLSSVIKPCGLIAARDVTVQNNARIEVARQQGTALTRLAELEQFHRLTSDVSSR